MVRSFEELMRVAAAHVVTKKKSRLSIDELAQVGWARVWPKHLAWNPEGKTDDDYEKYIVFTAIRRMITYSIIHSGVHIGPNVALPRNYKPYHARSAGEHDVLIPDPQREKIEFEFRDLVDFLCRGLDEREQLIFVTYCLEPKKRFMKICHEIGLSYQLAVFLLEYKVLPIVRVRYLVAFAALDKTKVSQDPEFLLAEREEIYRRNCRASVRKNGDRKAEGRKRILANIGRRLVGSNGGTNSGPSEEDLLARSEETSSEGLHSSGQGIGTNN